MAYDPPISDRQHLYINVGDFNTINLTDLLEQAQDHFGPCELSDLAISPQFMKTGGCSCCFDFSDYENWVCVTLV